jgi:serine/threonine-protein kinase
VSGRYRVHVLIGQGGMGKVFRAQQIPLGRPVALKVLEASRVDPEFQRRFFREAAILAKLKSRHTVTIYDYGRDNDLYFIAMELVAGGSLAQLLAAEGPLGVPRTLAIAQQICRSLREAHSQGVIHRDLKPGNVVLTQSEDAEELVKVLDFGLAKRVNANTEDTDSDTVPGSPKYMAPEVIRQQPIDGRTDIYSLGVMMYQMLTGVVPFDRDSPMDILVAHMHEPPPPMHAANPHVQVPAALERLVMRCLSKSPDERLPDVQTLLEALRAMAMELGLSSEPTSAGTTHSPDPAPSGVRSSVPSLRLAATDASGWPARTLSRRGLSRTARAAVVFGVIGAGALYGAIAWSRSSDAEPALAPAPVAPAPIAAPAAPSEPTLPAAAVAEPPAAREPRARDAVDMVIAPDQAGTTALSGTTAPALRGGPSMPALKLRVASQPAGAVVFIQMQRIGVTPLEYDWRSAQARIGGELTLVLEYPGFAAKTIRRRIEAAKMDVSAVLQPLRPVEPARAEEPPPPAAEPPPAPSPSEEPSAEAVEAAEGEDEEVLQIRPVRIGEGSRDEDDAQDEAPPEIEPNPFRQ